MFPDCRLLEIIKKARARAVVMLEIVTGFVNPGVAFGLVAMNCFGCRIDIFSHMPEIQNLRGGMLLEPWQIVAGSIADSNITSMRIALLCP